jgi:glutathione peroxidase
LKRFISTSYAEHSPKAVSGPTRVFSNVLPALLLGFAGLMTTVFFSSPALADGHAAPDTHESKSAQCSSLLNFEFKRLGESTREQLCDVYQGKLILVVNTASKCAFTPQYEGLEALYERYQNQGLVVLGFPSNDFFGQEPGTEKEIQEFCELTYGVNFPMFEKVHAAKSKAHPFYQQLAQVSGEYPGWNFHKYLIGPDGEFIQSFSSRVKPQSEALVNVIEANLPTQ